MASIVGFSGSVGAQQDICYHKVRHIICHYADGKTVTYDTDAAAEFYNARPAVTFRTTDGNLHAILGGCEIVCHP